MSDHFGNYRVHGKVISDSISGGNLVITAVDADTIDVSTLLINGTEFDPENISTTGSFDSSAIQAQIDAISGSIDLNTTNISTNAANIANNASDIVDLQNEVDSIQVSAGGGVPMEINSGLTSNFVITETGRENYVGFDTSTGEYTVTMRATPSEGDKVYVVDENSNAFANNITVDGNGNNINCCATYLLNYNNAGVLFVFAGGAWRAIRN